MCRLILSLLLGSVWALAPQPSYAQDSAEEKVELSGTRKQLATIVFAGLAGAILGLSTLSFYGRPQDHLSNIAVGFAVGVISGTIYTTYQAATKPYEVYDISNFDYNDEAFKREQQLNQLQPSIFAYSWNF